MALPRRVPVPARPDSHIRGADWRHRAACRDADPEIFFPVAESGAPLARAEARALAWCARCPVRAECLAYALAVLPDGIAGGMTARQRRELRRTTHVPAPGDRRPGPLAPGHSVEVRAEGIELLIKGQVSRTVIAQRCRVSRRTVDRWAARPECVAAGVRPAEPTASRVNTLSRREAQRCGARRVS